MLLPSITQAEPHNVIAIHAAPRACHGQTGGDTRCAVLGEVLDHLGTGVALLDAKSHILYMNSEARRLVASHDGVTVHDRRLTCVSATKIGCGKDFLSAVFGTGCRERASDVVTTVPLSNCTVGLTVDVSRLKHAPSLEFPAYAVVFMTDPRRRALTRTQIISALFRLSEKEAALATSILDGKSVKQHAYEQGVTLATVRTHLRSVLIKTQTRRQAELASVLSRSLPNR